MNYDGLSTYTPAEIADDFRYVMRECGDFDRWVRVSVEYSTDKLGGAAGHIDGEAVLNRACEFITASGYTCTVLYEGEDGASCPSTMAWTLGVADDLFARAFDGGLGEFIDRAVWAVVSGGAKFPNGYASKVLNPVSAADDAAYMSAYEQ